MKALCDSRGEEEKLTALGPPGVTLCHGDGHHQPDGDGLQEGWTPLTTCPWTSPTWRSSLPSTWTWPTARTGWIRPLSPLLRKWQQHHEVDDS